MSSLPFTAFVSWPSAPFTEVLVRKALASSDTSPIIVSSLSQATQASRLLQWSTYDDIEHELTNSKHDSVISSSYTYRKCLIRKHFLSRCIFSYLTKHPSSILKHTWPRTFEVEISYVDELDELFADELWELGEELVNTQKWWILKPGMADRGNGIRIFNDRVSLEKIFTEFEDGSDDESEDDNSTAVVTSQLRHFVIQEYILNPLLLDPREVLIAGSEKPVRLQGHKFHLRAYCVASGALKLYLYNRILALFSAVPYNVPDAEADTLDLSPHLTNTSLQAHRGEEGVRLMEELVGCHILSESDTGPDDLILTAEDVSNITQQMTSTLAEIFKAALDNPVNFQVRDLTQSNFSAFLRLHTQALPNAFELFGVDFLVAHNNAGFQVKVLELNAEPAIELTGPRLAWILEDLFVAIRRVCVDPFFSEIPLQKDWAIGDQNLIKCLEVEVRGSRI